MVNNENAIMLKWWYLIMKEKELISVIVIAYNIENYISKCIKSIENQNYKNLEIIIVDDGSTDQTIDKAYQLSLKDTRIRIIKKENGGPSSARNNGLEEAKGDYIVFVDGDDYVSADYVSYLYNLIKNSCSDFAMSKNLFSNIKQNQIKNDKIQILTPNQATALLMSTRVVVGSYNKIYKKSFLKNNNLKFDESLFYGEGLHFITRVSQLANKICVGERRIYYYRKNNYDSATTSFNIQKVLNGEKSILKIRDNLIIKSKLINDMITLHLSVYYLGAAVNLINHHQKADYMAEYKKWLHYVRTHLVKLLMNRNVSLYRKLMLTGGVLFPSLIAKLDIIRRQRIIVNSYN